MVKHLKDENKIRRIIYFVYRPRWTYCKGSVTEKMLLARSKSLVLHSLHCALAMGIFLTFSMGLTAQLLTISLVTFFVLVKLSFGESWLQYPPHCKDLRQNHCSSHLSLVISWKEKMCLENDFTNFFKVLSGQLKSRV